MPSAPIFISYSRRNRDAVRRIYSRMKAAGYPLWRDLSDLEPGDKWWPQIQEAIDACDSMVLCMSVESLLSTVVGDEWNYARQHGKRVVPAVVDEVFKHERVASGEVKIPRWMSDADWLDLREDAPESDLHWQRLFKTLDTPYEPRRRPMMIPRLPDQYIDRPQEKEPVIEALLDADNHDVALTTALKGAGGYGKTTLACAIARDVRVSGAYDDGLLFVTLGESLSESALIAKVLDLIETITQQRPALADANAARVALNDAIGDRNILLVVDDVWDAAHLAPFLVEGLRCAKLITTRNERLLPAGAQRHLIDQMRPQEALALLTWGLPEAPRTLNPRLTALADRLGRWAQVLKMVNGVLRQQTAQGQTLAGALDYVGEGLTEEGLEAFDDPSSTNQRHRTARAALAVSLRQLKDDADRAAFAQLAIFPEDADVPLAVLEKLWGRSAFKTRALCDTFFAGLALLQEYNAGAGTLRLHDVIRADLRVQHQESLLGWNTALLAALGDSYSLPNPYAWRFYAYHLLEAGQADRLRTLLLDFRWLRVKLEALDAAVLVSDCDVWLDAQTAASLETREPVRLLRSALTNSEHVLAQDKDALAHQLVGRLMLHRRSQGDIRALTDAAQKAGGLFPVNLKSEYPVLNPAGGLLFRTLAGHKRGINGALVLTDGRILSWSDDDTLRLWSSEGTLFVILKGHTDRVTDALILIDGNVLSWGRDGTLRLWSPDGVPLMVLKGHSGGINGAQVLSNGHILSWSRDCTLQLWAPDGLPLAILDGHSREVGGAQVLPDGRILSWSADSTLRLWSSDGAPLAILEGHSGGINGTQVLSNGRILSWSDDSTLRLWSPDGAPLAVLVGHSREVSGAQILSDERILSWSRDWTLRLWSPDGTPQAVLEGHRSQINRAQALPDGRILSWSRDGSLRLWSSDGILLTTLAGHTNTVEGAQLLPDKRILSWGKDGTLQLWSPDGVPLMVLKGHSGKIRGAQALPNGHILSWSDDRTLRLWLAKGATTLDVTQGHTDSVGSMQVLPNEHILSWAGGIRSEDSILRLWSSDGAPLAVLEGHSGGINGAQVLSNGRILSWSRDCTLQLWAPDGLPLAILDGHSREVGGAQVLPDGRILSWSRDSTLRLWSSDGAPLAILEGHSREVGGAQVLPDGRILSWSADNTLRLWSPDGAPLAVLVGHSGGINGAQMLSDGRILSWSRDWTLRLWSSEGEPLIVLEGHTDRVENVRVLSDGRILSWVDQIFSKDYTLRLWSPDGAPLAVLVEHKSWIRVALVLPDGRILSCSHNKICLWSQESTSLAVLNGFTWRSPDRELLWARAREQGFDPNLIFDETDEPTLGSLRLTDEGQKLIAYDRATGATRAVFHGDAEITALAVLADGQTVAVGDAAGRVFCLRYVPPAGSA